MGPGVSSSTSVTQGFSVGVADILGISLKDRLKSKSREKEREKCETSHNRHDEKKGRETEKQ